MAFGRHCPIRNRRDHRGQNMIHNTDFKKHFLSWVEAQHVLEIEHACILPLQHKELCEHTGSQNSSLNHLSYER